MKRLPAGLGVGGLLLISLVGCKTKSEIRREQELERIRQEVTQARGAKADLEVQLEELRTEVARLGSLLDEHTQQNRNQFEEVKREMGVLSTRVQAIESRAVEEEIANKKASEERARATFENGKKHYDEGRYDEAADVFRAIIKQRPQSDEGRRSQYYLAESHFNSKDYATAALEFAQYVKAHPKDSLVPTCIYRQAQAFKNMGKPKEAKLFYQEIVEKFPKHPLVAKAKQEMKKLK